MSRTCLIALLSAATLLVACQSRVQLRSSSPPPGHMKKIMGTQSAKPFAPGQQKKHKKP